MDWLRRGYPPRQSSPFNGTRNSPLAATRWASASSSMQACCSRRAWFYASHSSRAGLPLCIRFASYFSRNGGAGPAIRMVSIVYLMPQPERYQLEMELAACLLLVFVPGQYARISIQKYRVAVVVALLVFGAIQTRTHFQVGAVDYAFDRHSWNVGIRIGGMAAREFAQSAGFRTGVGSSLAGGVFRYSADRRGIRPRHHQSRGSHHSIRNPLHGGWRPTRCGCGESWRERGGGGGRRAAIPIRTTGTIPASFGVYCPRSGETAGT